MRTKGLHNPPLAQRPRTNLGGISSENPLDGLIKLVQELTKSVTETSSKMREPKTYDETVYNPVNRSKKREAINEELWNLNSHQIWCYILLPPNYKLIGCK